MDDKFYSFTNALQKTRSGSQLTKISYFTVPRKQKKYGLMSLLPVARRLKTNALFTKIWSLLMMVHLIVEWLLAPFFFSDVRILLSYSE